MKKPLRLRLVKKVVLRPSSPFFFDTTFYKPDHFTSGDNCWQPGTRWQTWRQGKETLGLKFRDIGSNDKPEIGLFIYGKKAFSQTFFKSLLSEINYRYNLSLDLTDFYNFSKNDKVLKAAIDRLRGMRPGHPSSLYEYLIIGVVLQNATVRRSIQMFEALLKNYGILLGFDGKKLWCFWPAGGLTKVTEEELRALKIGYRAKMIKRIDDYFAEGKINEMDLRKKNREEQTEELLKLYGVGPATVWYLLFDVFHQWDFFNHISPWEQKIYSKLFFNSDPEKPVPVEKLFKYFEKYGQYKQLVVHYLWEDLWWRRKKGQIFWLEKLIRT